MLIILTIRKAAEAVSRCDFISKILFSTSLLSKYPFAKAPLPMAAGLFCVRVREMIVYANIHRW